MYIRVTESFPFGQLVDGKCDTIRPTDSSTFASESYVAQHNT
jgi:hypothetical protein